MAGEALHSRIYSLHKLLGPMINGRSPIVHADGCYRLNAAAGVGVDVACFDELATSGHLLTREGQFRAAAAAYQKATQLYRGDLCVATDLHAVVERERLRACYLDLLATLAADAYGTEDDAACLVYAGHVLQHDPCREDAHRLIMRCYLRRDQRAQALHQFRVCQSILSAEFDAAPEPATIALFEQIRLDPRRRGQRVRETSVERQPKLRLNIADASGHDAMVGARGLHGRRGRQHRASAPSKVYRSRGYGPTSNGPVLGPRWMPAR